MSIFGCHSCSYVPSPDIPYLESPCATCKLAVEYTNTKRAAMFDSCGTSEDAEEQHEQFFAKVDESLENFDQPKPTDEIKGITPEALEILRSSMEQQIMIAMSGIMVRLLKLAKTSPVMFELVLKKMQYPYMSYSALGASMAEPCSKQNVLYHLKHAVELFPELSTTLLTDTRFSGGRYALQTVANRVRQEYAKRRIQGLLYGELDPAVAERSMKELNAILHAPFLVSEEAIDFNPYINDELEG